MTSIADPTAVTATISTPIGSFTIVAEAGDRPVVLASGWTADIGDLMPLIAPALRPAGVRKVTAIPGLTEAATAYHDGDIEAIDRIEVRQVSGPFLEHAWAVLRQVPAGAPITYSDYAAKSGRPAAIRAAASACARNAAALFVPCHRVLRLDGTLGGFRWGLPAKSWLLEHEAAN